MKFHFCQTDRYEIRTCNEFQAHMRIKRNIQRVCEHLILIVKAKKCQKKTHHMSFLSLMIYSVVKVKKKYYPETLLEECKYETQNIKMENLINDKLETSSSDDETDSDTDNDETESDNEKDNDESNEEFAES